jgi:hypothetical protein
MTTIRKIDVLTLLALVLLFFIYIGNLKIDLPVSQKMLKVELNTNNKTQTKDQHAKKYNTISNYNSNSSINPCN